MRRLVDRDNRNIGKAAGVLTEEALQWGKLLHIEIYNELHSKLHK